MTRFYPALCSVTFRALTPAAIVELAASAGLAGIEWGADLHVRPGELAEARAVRHLTETNGLQVASYGSYWRPGAEFSDLIDTALALGAATIRIWPGFSGRDSAGYSADERFFVADSIRAMVDSASRVGITLGLEYHPKTLTDDLASAQGLLAQVNHLDVFTYWQPRPGASARCRIDGNRGADAGHFPSSCVRMGCGGHALSIGARAELLAGGFCRCAAWSLEGRSLRDAGVRGR